MYRLVVSAVAMAAAFAVAECATRFAYRHDTSSGHAGDFIARHGGDASPSVNSLGFREGPIGPKDPNLFRIAVIGDSFAWGQGVQEHERFSNLLDAQLGPRYEVLNFGMPGHTMPEHVDELEPVLKLNPDFVLLQLYINNFETPGMRRPSPYSLLPADLNARLTEASLVYQLLADRWAQLQESLGLVDSYARYLARHLRDPNSPDSREAFGKLRQFISRTRAAGVPTGAVLFPATDSMGPNGLGYPFGFIHDRVQAICAEERIVFVDLLAPFASAGDPHSLWVTPFDAHPNALANQRAAAEILDAFAESWRR
jgi:lysophospholipase L1-like esterase